jgi:N-acetylmuramoyl-L-alanine amidase
MNELEMLKTNLEDKKTVVLNPGHIPEDDRKFIGPETEGGNNKKTVALIKKYLEEYIVDVKIETQEDGIPFNKIGTTYPNSTLFFSFHTNAFEGGVGKGTEVFYHYGRTLAQRIAQRTAVLLETKVRGDMGGAKRNSEVYGGAGFSVINKAVKSGIKYQLMAEIGFHDNPDEVKHIVGKRDLIARAIAEEIALYLELEKKPVKEIVTLAPKGKLFQVALGAYKDRENAQETLEKAKLAGLRPYLVIVDDPKYKK